MGIADFFRPKHRHSDVRVRAEAVRAMTNDDADTLVQIAKTDRDPQVRRIAIEKLDEADLLADIAKDQDDRALRDLAGERAADLWVQSACDEDDEVVAGNSLEGLIGLDHQRALAQVAAKAVFDKVRRRAAGALRDGRALADLARSSNDAATRLEAVARIDDQDTLRALAIDVAIKEVGIAAVDALDDAAALEQIAQKAKAKQVRQRARKKLTDREEAQKQAQPKTSDDIKRRRAEKAQALRTMEQLAETFDWEKADAQVDRAEREWAAIGDSGDAALDEKFARLVKRYRDRRHVHDVKLEESRHAHAPATARPAPAPVRPERSASEASAESKDDEDVIAPAAAAAPDPAREARQAEAAARRAERDAKRAEEDARRAQETADREERKKEAIERGKQIAASLEALCADLEQMTDSTDQRGVQRLLDQAAKVYESIGKVAPEQRDALDKRYTDARAKLVIKLKDLRETEDWARWANVPRQEALIKEAEALAAADAPTLPTLQDLQKRWKTVGPVPQNKSKELWEKFKTASDAAFAKIRGAREVEKAKWDENVGAREALIKEAEAIADSTDFEATAEQMKGLQARWKSLGPVPRKQGDALWKQFRAACDRFFERRKPMLEAKNAELLENLARKEQLCAKIEALVEAAPGEGGWGAAIRAAQDAQRAWRDIGWVPRRDADAIYARFRTACDALFAKRDAARDAEAEAQRAEVEALRGEIEAATTGAAAIAVHGKLRALAERGLSPSIELNGLYERMVRTVIASDPAGLRGSELDPEAAQRRREKIVARAEELLPKEQPAIDAGAAPEDVAAKLRAALKSNALGGVRWERDPREIVDELRAEWAAIGPVIGDAAEALRAKLEDIAAKVIAAAGGEREVSRESRESRDESRDDRGSRRRERRQRRDQPRDEARDTTTSAIDPSAISALGAARAATATEPALPVPVEVASPTDVTKPAPLPAAPAMPEEPAEAQTPPAASEMAGDGATEGDVDAGWD
ncbi:MAG TPA: DUF349 domain-containing protein [Kofleriaceae bacterium]|nr:DUF349 domain-containing protein [Kofleriaceae bacterium]